MPPSGVDGRRGRPNEATLTDLTDLHERVHRGAYRALPSRRRYIPKADGNSVRWRLRHRRQDRPESDRCCAKSYHEETSSGSATGSDPSEVAQCAGCAGRRDHEQASDFIFDADGPPFDSVSKDWLVRFGSTASAICALSARSRSGEAGVLEKRGVTVSEKGRGRIGISPLLANVYCMTVRPLGQPLATDGHGRHEPHAFADDMSSASSTSADAGRF